MAKASVLFMSRTYPPMRSTSGRLLYDLAHAFEKEGWRVTILTTSRDAVNEIDGTISIIQLRSSKNPSRLISAFWTWLKMFITALSLPKHDLIVTLADPPLLVVAGHLLKKIKKTSHIHWCQELYPDLFQVMNTGLPQFTIKPLKYFSRQAMNGCEKVIVPGRCMAKHLVRTGIDRNKISLIPNWSDPQLTRHPNKNSGSTSNAYIHGTKPALPFDDTPKFRVMHTGHIKPFHALSTILEAAEILDTQYPEIEFVFVGSGAPFDGLAEERARKAVRNIRLIPFQPAEQAELVMKMGDIHLVSLNDNAAGLVVPRRLYTAFEVARPCIFIGAANTETALTIKEYKAGEIVAPGDAEKLAGLITHYRLNGDAWFAAQEGARKAGQAYNGADFMKAWIKRAGRYQA